LQDSADEDMTQLSEDITANTTQITRVTEAVAQAKHLLANYLGRTASNFTTASSPTFFRPPPLDTSMNTASTPGSDVNQRLPQFHEVQAAIDAGVNSGVYEGLPENITTYLNNAQPVGLDEHGTLILPPDYDPMKGPAILVLKPGESGYAIKGNDSLVAALHTLVERSGATLEGYEDEMSGQAPATRADIFVTRYTVNVSPDSGGPAYPIAVPVVIGIRPHNLANPESLATSMAHEADHWDFVLNEVPTLQRNNRQQPYLDVELAGALESRAYDTSYMTEVNKGTYDAAKLDSVLQSFQGAPYSELDAALRTVSQEFGYPPPYNQLSYVLTATVIRKLYGHPDEPITADELAGYQRFGLLH
jgi:hypothetical protein